MSKITLYRHPLSGHSHRVELLLSLLGLHATIIDVDLIKAAHKQPEFLKKNIFAQVPVLEDGEETIADSNAILTYLAIKYDPKRSWLPVNATQAAQVQRFLTIAADKVAHGPASARLINVFSADLNKQLALDTSHTLFSVLNSYLHNRLWLATNQITIADIANYTYIAHAPEGDVSLDKYPHICNWLKRIESLEGFIPMQKTKVGLVA